MRTRTIIFNTVEELTYAIINELGFMIGHDNLLYEQSTRNIINIEGKNLKCTLDRINNPVFESEYNMVFDPISNLKLMTLIMEHYFKKEEEEGNFYVSTYSIEEIEKRGPSYIRATMNNRPTSPYNNCTTGASEYMIGKAYYNKCLSICDIILRFGGFDPDLSNLDIRE